MKQKIIICLSLACTLVYGMETPSQSSTQSIGCTYKIFSKLAVITLPINDIESSTKKYVLQTLRHALEQNFSECLKDDFPSSLRCDYIKSNWKKLDSYNNSTIYVPYIHIANLMASIHTHYGILQLPDLNYVINLRDGILPVPTSLVDTYFATYPDKKNNVKKITRIIS